MTIARLNGNNESMVKDSHMMPPTIAIIIPCYNEEVAITQVVCDFKLAMPDADVIVFDNNSSDRTAEFALNAGAQVQQVSLRGKGNVVRRMFADIDADIYIMVDGDATYDAGSASALVNKLLHNNMDMVVGCRVTDGKNVAYRSGHRLGNALLTSAVRNIFGGHFSDMLSGYRVFSKRYVKSFPAHSTGFEIETELTVHALELRMPYCEVETPYGERPEGSASKLSTYCDGLRILKTIIRLYMFERPLAFFSIIFLILSVLSILFAVPIFIEFSETGLVPRLPTVVLSVGFMLSGILSLVCGLLLDTVNRGRHEVRRLAYLAIPSLLRLQRK